MEISNLVSAIRHEGVVAGLTHNFYRYPARFSPHFSRAAIELFTKPGDTVLDPFVGSGTSLVESLALGRHAVGGDISELAVFLAQAKTRLVTESGLKQLLEWAMCAANEVSPLRNLPIQEDWMNADAPVNLPWRFRKLASQSVYLAIEMLSPRLQRIARCIVLRTAQWAMDCRKSLPIAEEFRVRLQRDAGVIVEGLRQLRIQVKNGDTSKPRIEVYNCSADKLADQDSPALKKRLPRLVVTSPPYPGVHVLYHRWQVLGRRETAAPFWIAACNDGEGSAYYTFGDRRRSNRDDYYFQQLSKAFGGVRKVVDDECVVAQLVGFSDPDEQLPRYLDTMQNEGFRELATNHLGFDSSQKRFWRDVPNRKWYNSLNGNSQTKEVLLLHRAC